MQSESFEHPYARGLNDDLVSLPDYALKNKLTPFISMQNHYNLLYREDEREMFPTLKVGFIVSFFTANEGLIGY